MKERRRHEEEKGKGREGKECLRGTPSGCLLVCLLVCWFGKESERMKVTTQWNGVQTKYSKYGARQGASRRELLYGVVLYHDENRGPSERGWGGVAFPDGMEMGCFISTASQFSGL